MTIDKVLVGEIIPVGLVAFMLYWYFITITGWFIPKNYSREVHSYAKSRGWVLIRRGVIESIYKKGCFKINLIPHAGLEHNKPIIDYAEDQVYRESKLAESYMEILNG